MALVGPSGCGKSTLLEIACGLREPSAGTIAVEGGTDAAERLARCAYMPQRDLLLPWFSALDNAALALRNRGVGRAEARREAGELFERFGLAGFEGSRPEELSGGMRQRVAFLRTLVAGKPVLALDEPFASLDAISRAEMQEWLAGALRAEARTVLLVSHDIEEALYLADRVVVLSARPGPDRQRAAGARPARRRPRRRRHRPGLRRRPRGGAAGPPRRGAMTAALAPGAVRAWLLPAALIAALIGAWQIAASNGAIAEALNLEPFLVPSPAEVGDALWNSRSVLWENTWVTLREILVGIGVGVLARPRAGDPRCASRAPPRRRLPAHRRRCRRCRWW